LTVRVWEKENPVFQRYKSFDLPRITTERGPSARPTDDDVRRACNPLADYHFDVRYGQLHGIYDYNDETNNIKNALLRLERIVVAIINRGGLRSAAATGTWSATVMGKVFGNDCGPFVCIHIAHDNRRNVIR